MEPKFSSPEMSNPNQERSPESMPNLPNPETTPEFPLPSLERGQTAAPERAPEHAAQAQASLAAQPIPITLPTPVPVADAASDDSAISDSPAVAGDEDLIEKEWVDRAKLIISETRDDPAARERQVGKLQADYLKKRYGKDLGASSSD